jgi:hypothetical protein
MNKVKYTDITEPFRKAGEWVCLDWNFDGDEIRINRFKEKPKRNDMLEFWYLDGKIRSPFVEFNRIGFEIPEGMTWRTSLLEPIKVAL